MKAWMLCLLLVAVTSTVGIAQQPPLSGEQLTSPTATRALNATGVEPLPAPTPSVADSPDIAFANGASLADLERIALTNNPTMGQAAARVEATRGHWVQVGLYPNPTIGYEGTEIGNNGKAGFQGGFISQQIVTGGKLDLNRAVASQEIDQAERQLEVQRFRVTSDVRIQFYSVLVAQRTWELSSEILKFSEQGLAATVKLLDAKEISGVELLQASVESGTAKIELENANQRYWGAWRRLTAVAGVPGMKPVRLLGNLESGIPELTWEQSLGRLLATSPELAATRAGVDRAQWTLTRAEAEIIPNLELRSGVQHDNSSRYNVANVELALSIPLFNRNQGAIRQAQAELCAAQADVHRVELDLHHRLATAFERYAAARNQTEKYSKDILPNSQKALELVTTGYRKGEFNFLILLTTQRTYAQTNLSYINSLREQWESSIAIDNLLLTDSLQNAGGPSERLNP